MDRQPNNSGSAGQFTLKIQWIGNLILVDRQVNLHWRYSGSASPTTGIPYCGSASPTTGIPYLWIGNLSTGIPYCGSASIPYCGSATSPLAYPIVDRQAYPIVGQQPLHWHTLLWIGKHTLLWVSNLSTGIPYCGSAASPQATPNCGLST